MNLTHRLGPQGTPVCQPSDTQVSETEAQWTTPVLLNSSIVIHARASSINLKADSSTVGVKHARLSVNWDGDIPPTKRRCVRTLPQQSR